MATTMVESIPLDVAKQTVEAAEERADELDVPVVITVTNAEGNLIALHRMDDAKLVSVNISKNKAYTAAAVRKPTHDLKEASEPGGDVYGLFSTDENRVIVFGGGFPLERDADVVGGIGVSGGAVEEDMEIAQAGIGRFEDEMADEQ